MPPGSYHIAVIDLHANVGGGRRFTGSLVRSLHFLRPSWSIRLITSKEALDNHWLGDMENIDTIGIVTEDTLRHFFSDGRSLGIPGTWYLKSTIRHRLLKIRYRIANQMKQALKGIDLAYFSWINNFEHFDCSVPRIVTMHDLLWKHADALTPSDRAKVERNVPLWFAGSRAVVTSTNAMRQEIERFYPEQAKRIEVVPLPVPELPMPMGGGERLLFLERSNIRGPFVFCPAGLWVHKNHKNLVRAFARLKERKTNPILVCTGMYTDQAFGANPPGPIWMPAKELRELTIEEGLIPGQDIIGLGHVSDSELATLYATAACVVMPVTYEAGSFPILEGAAQGVPIACSDIPVYREQADIHGLQPVYFDPHQSKTIAEAIERLISARPSTEELDTIAQRVRARSWLDVAREYLQVFESVI